MFGLSLCSFRVGFSPCSTWWLLWIILTTEGWVSWGRVGCLATFHSALHIRVITSSQAVRTKYVPRHGLWGVEIIFVVIKKYFLNLKIIWFLWILYSQPLVGVEEPLKPRDKVRLPQRFLFQLQLENSYIYIYYHNLVKSFSHSLVDAAIQSLFLSRYKVLGKWLTSNM